VCLGKTIRGFFRHFPSVVKLPICSGCVEAIGMKWLSLRNLIWSCSVFIGLYFSCCGNTRGKSVCRAVLFIYLSELSQPPFFLSPYYKNRKFYALTTPLIQSPLRGMFRAKLLQSCLWPTETFSSALSKLPALTDSVLHRARAKRRHPQLWRTWGWHWPHQSGSSSKNKTGTSFHMSSIHPTVLSDISEAR